MNDTNSPARIRALLIAAGAIAILISVLIGQQKYGTSPQYTLSQANALCSSGIGQLGQLLNANAAHNCSAITTAEQWRGWLMLAGIASVTAGFAWGMVTGKLAHGQHA